MLENRLRWKPGKRGHYEGYYFAFNDPESGRGFWIRYSMVSPSDDGGRAARPGLVHAHRPGPGSPQPGHPGDLPDRGPPGVGPAVLQATSRAAGCALSMAAPGAIASDGRRRSRGTSASTRSSPPSAPPRMGRCEWPHASLNPIHCSGSRGRSPKTARKPVWTAGSGSRRTSSGSGTASAGTGPSASTWGSQGARSLASRHGRSCPGASAPSRRSSSRWGTAAG